MTDILKRVVVHSLFNAVISLNCDMQNTIDGMNIRNFVQWININALIINYL